MFFLFQLYIVGGGDGGRSIQCEYRRPSTHPVYMILPLTNTRISEFKKMLGSSKNKKPENAKRTHNYNAVH